MRFPQQLLEEISEANKTLRREGLVTSTSGNVSGRDPKTNLVAIKPSGVDYDKLTPQMLAIVDLDGRFMAGDGKPSVDLSQHLFLYRHLPEVNSVIHTHSNFATAFAAVGRPIPCCLTAIADEFGTEIPCAPYVDNQGDNIGEAILKYRHPRTPAILLANHGVFTFAESLHKAVKAAIMVEDVAKTVFYALQMGKPAALPPEEIEKWFSRYHTTYGQSK
ncbi:MAG: L-ribulose-5-phosphate 4-epimerase [Phycisphaerae bacterium]